LLALTVFRSSSDEQLGGMVTWAGPSSRLGFAHVIVRLILDVAAARVADVAARPVAGSVCD
jgi:hypothetical protein